MTYSKTYAYSDGMNLTSITDVSATTREYVWLPGNDYQNDTLAKSTLPQLAGGGARRAEEVPPDLPLAIAEGTALYQVHTDHLGRPVRMTDAARATVWQASWKPWGEIENISGTILNNLRFPGQYFQIETNLAYNHHRHYDPVTGRYTQPDPLGFVDGPSVYAYAGNSPFMRTDRSGLDLVIIGGEGSASSGLGVTGGAGVVFDMDNGGAGAGYGSVGVTTGFGAYAGGGIGYFTGDICDFTGTSVGWTFNLGFGQVTIFRSGGHWGGFISGGSGAGIPGVRGGTSGSVSTTRITGQDCKCPPTTN